MVQNHENILMHQRLDLQVKKYKQVSKNTILVQSTIKLQNGKYKTSIKFYKSSTNVYKSSVKFYNNVVRKYKRNIKI